jgi:hypothetical protein
MTSWEQHTISNRRLKLTKKQFLFHYFFVLVLPLTIIGITTLVLNNSHISPAPYQSIKNTVLKFCSFFSMAYGVVQYFRLQMTSMPIELSKDDFHKIGEKLIKDMNWVLEAKGDNFLVCTIPFKWYNWGTLITIIHTEDCVMFNSICDLYNRPATLSFGQNSKNYQALKAAFNTAQ